MSYARINDEDCDVYVFRDAGTKNFECYGCCFETKRRSVLIAHLLGHRLQGDAVPSDVFAQLLKEIEERKP